MAVSEVSNPGEAVCQNWDAFRYFLAVARCGSLSGAARYLNESQPTVGRKVRELETSLSAQLVERHRAGIQLTAAGQAVLDHIVRIESEARAMRDNISGRDKRPEGKVVVTVPEGFGHIVLLPQLEAFRARFPHIEIEALICTRKVNLVEREADVALRLGDPVHGSLIGRRVGVARMGLFAHERYIARRSLPRSIAELADHDIVDGANELGSTCQAKHLKLVAGEARRVLRTDSVLAQLSAVSLGLGIAALPQYVAKSHSNLVEVLQGAFGVEEHVWVLMNKDLKSISRVQIVSNFLFSIAQGAFASKEAAWNKA